MKKMLFAYTLGLAIFMLAGLQVTAVQAQSLQNLDHGAQRNCGNSYQLKLEQAEAALKQVTPDKSSPAYVQALGDLAQLNWQGRQFLAAKSIYETAYQVSQTPQQQREFAFMLGNINATQTLYKQAEKWWLLAQDPNGENLQWQLTLEMNRLRLHSRLDTKTSLRQPELQRLQTKILTLANQAGQQTFALTTGLHLLEILLDQQGDVEPDSITAWAQQTEVLSEQVTEPFYRVQTLRLNARVAALQNQLGRALRYLSQASVLANSRTDLQFQAMQIEQQRAQIYEKLGQSAQVKRAYQRALFYVEQLRSDLPLFDEFGRSYHQTLLQPLYLGYARFLLQEAAQLNQTELQTALRQLREVIEHSKRSEMQDYLGERCSTEQLTQNQNKQAYQLAPDSAIVYPIVLENQLEILLETTQGLERFSIPQTSVSVQEQVRNWVQALRLGQVDETRAGAKQLWQTLIAPIQASLHRQKVGHLIIIPDAALRLLPFAALSDGEQYLVQHYRISISPGLNLLKSGEPALSAAERRHNLLAGMSEPGGVVNKLPEGLVQQVLAASETRGNARGGRLQGAIRGYQTELAQVAPDLTVKSLPARRASELKQALALQGVEQEIGQLQNLLGNGHTTLLNQQFTATAFASQIQHSSYSGIHIASHGVFGGDAEHTFIMAYDDVINLRQLQGILQSRQGKNRLDLLTLSACETAEGDERAPLGLSGAALQANARSALGSLWSVSDQATSLLMQEFYRARLQGLDKAAALRQAQLYLMSHPDYQAAFFWAAFILVGNHL